MQYIENRNNGFYKNYVIFKNDYETITWKNQ